MKKSLVVLSLSLTSCVTGATVTESVREERVINRAKWDLNCKDGTISVQKIDDTSYAAQGCGKEAVYALDNCHRMNWASVCQAILNGEVRDIKK